MDPDIGGGRGHDTRLARLTRVRVRSSRTRARPYCAPLPGGQGKGRLAGKLPIDGGNVATARTGPMNRNLSVLGLAVWREALKYPESL